MKHFFSFLLIAFLTFGCFSCTYNSSESSLNDYYSIIKESLLTNTIEICGTIHQFYLDTPIDKSLKSISPTSFICSTQYPEVFSLFTDSTIVLTGTMYTKTSKETDEIHIRGYINTSNIHYEGIFLLSNNNQLICFSIAHSINTKDVVYD